MFGGSTYIFGDNTLADTTLLQFKSVQCDDWSQQWTLHSVASAGQLTSPERLREKQRLKETEKSRVLPFSAQLHGPVEPPTLPELIRMKVPQEVGKNYTNFGIFLLEDRTGNRVDTIEEECCGKPDRITGKILQEWVLGKGAALTWQTLVKTLNDCKLNTLADRIQATKLPPAP